MSFQLTSRVGAQRLFSDRRPGRIGSRQVPLRVMVIVTINGTPQPLFDGVMTNVEVSPGQNEPGRSRSRSPAKI